MLNQYHTTDQNPLFFMYYSYCDLYFASRSVNRRIWCYDSPKIVKAVTKTMKVVQKASFWMGGLGRLERSQSLQRHTDVKSLHATFLFVFVETQLQCSESLARASFLWLRQRKGLLIINNQFLIRDRTDLLKICPVLHSFGQKDLAQINNNHLLTNNIFLMIAQSRKLTPFEKIWDIGTNFRYFVIGLIEAFDKSNLVNPGDCIYLLGQKIEVNEANAEEQNDIIFKKFSETPWLTYRSGFPQLYHDLKGTYVSDTGWGCMIRVGQMAFAEMIKEHKQIKTQGEMGEIIEMFNDFDNRKPFSIQNINKLARREYGILPGDWYNPSQIAHILSLLNQNYLENSLNLSFLVFNSGNLFFDQIVEVMLGGREKVVCECNSNQKQIICAKCNQNKLSIGVILLTRIGLEYPEQKYLKVLIEMMNFKASKGMIGGRPGKALYFIGSYNGQSMIYLDPHYVQQANSEMSEIQQTYFCGSFRTCKIKSIDPSIGICYYFRNFQELNGFYRDIQRLRESNENEFFIWASETTPPYLSKSIRISREIEIEEDHYEQL